ncbi:hypothetical protein CTAYLR_008200 [Chrysophaeum taylorii]|uniref:Uncharacterized protein n=1 Tax=Chrysophaeum taylorii TaxID=2483200 RepID=A0AAD7XK31_9STRA|nr:hypothetical protein CTAYLR_008200 [Chrysophaeum taylorii]
MYEGLSNHPVRPTMDYAAAAEMRRLLGCGWRATGEACPRCGTTILEGAGETVCVKCDPQDGGGKSGGGKSPDASERIGAKLLLGWVLLGDACPRCGVPLMRSPDGVTQCVACAGRAPSESAPGGWVLLEEPCGCGVPLIRTDGVTRCVACKTESIVGDKLLALVCQLGSTENKSRTSAAISTLARALVACGEQVPRAVRPLISYEISRHAGLLDPTEPGDDLLDVVANLSDALTRLKEGFSGVG